MYERFTDRARKAVQNANNVALGLNHEYLGTEHLLIGLIEGEGTVRLILEDLQLDGADIVKRTRAMLQPGPASIVVGRLPQTPRFKKVMEVAMAYARDLNNNYVGTEHLFLGLISAGADSVSGAVLSVVGCDINKAVLSVVKVNGTPRDVYSAVLVHSEQVESEQPESPGQPPATETHVYPIDPELVSPGIYEAYFRYALAAPGSPFNVGTPNPPKTTVAVYMGDTGHPRYVVPGERGEKGGEARDWMRIAKMVKLTS